MPGPHEWVIIASGSRDGTDATYGISDALFQFNQKFAEQQGALNGKLGPISIAGIFFGEQEVPATIEQSRLIEAVFPSTLVLASEADLLRKNDHQDLMVVSKKSVTPFSGILHFQKMSVSEINLLDLLYFNWAITRIVLREEVQVLIKVLDSSGELVYLDEIHVSPTILTDVLFSPIGCFQTYLEKHDSRPVVLFCDEIFYPGPGGHHKSKPPNESMPATKTADPSETPRAQ